MLATSVETTFRVVFSEKFTEGRDAAMFSQELDQKDPFFAFQWNKEWPLRPQQAAMAHKIVKQLEDATKLNTVLQSDVRYGQGYYNISAPSGGKTPISIAVCLKLQAQRVLVVALTSLLDQWDDEISKFHAVGFAPGTLVINSGADKASRIEAIEDFCKVTRGWAICGYATLRDHADDFLKACTDYDVVIFDESGVMRNENNLVAMEAEKLLARTKYVLHLNGTPVDSHGGQLHNIFRQCRAPKALSVLKDDFEEQYANIQTTWMEAGGKRFKKTIKSGIKNVFSIANNFSNQYGGLPKNMADLPRENPVIVNCPMNEEEELSYRALEEGYSVTEGLTAVEEYRESKERQRFSEALDEHRQLGSSTTSLASYLDLVSEVSNRLGTREVGNEDAEEDSETTEEPVIAPDMEILQEQWDSFQMEWELEQQRLDVVIQTRKDLASALEALKASMKDVNGKYPSGFILKEFPPVIKIVADHGAQGVIGEEIRAIQAAIREKQNEVAEKQRQIRVSEKLRAQTRSNTLIRLMRATNGSEYVVRVDGTRELALGSSAKTRWILEHIEANPTTKMVIFCKLRSAITYLQKSLEERGIECGAIWGGNSRNQADTLRRFKTMTLDEDGKRMNVLIIITDLGAGLNLQVASEVIFESKPFLASTVEQNIARVVRTFGMHKVVNVYHLFTVFANGNPTCDHYIQSIVDTKARTGNIFQASQVAPLKLRPKLSEQEEIDSIRQRMAELN